MSGAKPFDTGELSTDRMGSDAFSNFLLKTQAVPCIFPNPLSSSPKGFSAVRNFSPVHPRVFRGFCSTSLTKIAKHLALLACFMTIGDATGRPVLGQLGIFILVVLAALIHSAGCAVQSRFPVRIPPSKRLS
jgi:hypothetical protein